MKTPDEIKKGLACSEKRYCIYESCPYYSIDDLFECLEKSREDALAYIQQLEREKEELIKNKLFSEGTSLDLREVVKVCEGELLVAAINMISDMQAAAPKWIDMTIYPPEKGEIGFAYAPEEGWIQLVKVIESTPYKLDVEAIYPKHGIPCIGRYWMPLRFPEPPEEEE